MFVPIVVQNLLVGWVQCTDCKAWNTISEFREAKVPARGGNFSGFSGFSGGTEAKTQKHKN
jgi:hypothetical protein